MKKNRKSQEEMVGFVLIVVIVAILAVIFLGISLRKNREAVESGLVENFIQASMSYTTDCLIGARNEDIKDLIKSCYENRGCKDERAACSVLNETLDDLMKKTWKVGEDRPVKSYNLLIYYEENEYIKKLIEISEGNCIKASKIAESQAIAMPPGNLYMKLGICYSMS